MAFGSRNSKLLRTRDNNLIMLNDDDFEAIGKECVSTLISQQILVEMISQSNTNTSVAIM